MAHSVDYDKDNGEFHPDASALRIMARVEAPPPPLLNREKRVREKENMKIAAKLRGIAPKKPVKQMKLKTFMKKMEKNFQGFHKDKCVHITSLVSGVGKVEEAYGKTIRTPGSGNEYVYINPKYGKHTEKKYNNKTAPIIAKRFCMECLLKPCAMVEYGDILEEKMADQSITEESVKVSTLRTAYRHLIKETYNKTFLCKYMPTNDQIPGCAIRGTLAMARYNYDSESEEDDEISVFDPEIDALIRKTLENATSSMGASSDEEAEFN